MASSIETGSNIRQRLASMRNLCSTEISWKTAAVMCMPAIFVLGVIGPYLVYKYFESASLPNIYTPKGKHEALIEYFDTEGSIHKAKTPCPAINLDRASYTQALQTSLDRIVQDLSGVSYQTRSGLMKIIYTTWDTSRICPKP